jgi:hypothetical protein
MQTKQVTDGEILVKIMKDDGVPISAEDREKVIHDIDTAIDNNHIIFLNRANTFIGFVTYIPRETDILLNYCFVYRRFRNKANLIGLRKLFRSMSNKFKWKSRRRGRICIVR